MTGIKSIRSKIRFAVFIVCVILFYQLVLSDVPLQREDTYTNKLASCVKLENHFGKKDQVIVSKKTSVKGIQLLSTNPKTEHQWPYGGQDLQAECNRNQWSSVIHTHNLSTSVIITFIDRESVYSLLRTVHSVIEHTPKHLLKEVILIGDNIHREVFYDILNVYVDTVFGEVVSIHMNNNTLGLIKARLQGIRVATGHVIVCLDSHVEVQPYWLQPLLYEIQLNRKTLASCCLDWIENIDNHWIYRHGGSNWKTYFDMNLVFGWQMISPLQETKRPNRMEAIESPVTVGTWAMDRTYFLEVGELDEGMELWGGENLDLPIRVWLFGGRVVNVPCSHVGHLEKSGYREYRQNSQKTIHKNYMRFLLVWMEDYLQYFDPFFPTFKNIDAGDLSSRQILRQNKIHDIPWFRKYVFPELGIPQIDGIAWGKLKHISTGCCLHEHGYGLQFSDCHVNPSNMYFYWSRSHLELRNSMGVYDVITNENHEMVLEKHEYMSKYNMNQSSTWIHFKNGPLKLTTDNLCLSVDMKNNVVVRKCEWQNHVNNTQNWTFEHYSKDYDDIISGRSQTNKQF